MSKRKPDLNSGKYYDYRGGGGGERTVDQNASKLVNSY